MKISPYVHRSFFFFFFFCEGLTYGRLGREKKMIIKQQLYNNKSSSYTYMHTPPIARGPLLDANNTWLMKNSFHSLILRSDFILFFFFNSFLHRYYCRIQSHACALLMPRRENVHFSLSPGRDLLQFMLHIRSRILLHCYHNNNNNIMCVTHGQGLHFYHLRHLQVDI